MISNATMISNRRGMGLRALLVSLAACLPSAPQQPPPPPQVIDLAPLIDVLRDQPVVLRFDTRVSFSGPRWPLDLQLSNGANVPMQIVADVPADRLEIRPDPMWPEGVTISVCIAPGIVDLLGVALEHEEPCDPALRFSTAREEADPALRILVPPPGSRVAPNLLHIMVALIPPGADLSTLELSSERHQTTIDDPAPLGEGIYAGHLFQDPSASADAGCSSLCGGQTYHLGAGPGISVAEGLLGQIQTSTLPDHEAPIVLGTELDFAGDQIFLNVRSSKSSFVGAELFTEDGRVFALASPQLPQVDARLLPVEPLPVGVPLWVRIFGEDIYGNAMIPIFVAVKTPEVIEVELSEVVTTPLSDWGDSAPAGEPFDGTPGGGTVSDADEWIELVNLSPKAIDLGTAGLLLRLLDRSPAETRLELAPEIHFGAEGSASSWWPGEALVLRPRGTMSQRDLRVELFSGSRLLDRLVLGNGEGSDHPGGSPPDLDHQSLAKGTDGRWRWCRSNPRDPLPAVDCR